MANFKVFEVFGLNITLHPNLNSMNMKIRPPLNHSSSDLLHFPSINWSSKHNTMAMLDQFSHLYLNQKLILKKSELYWVVYMYQSSYLFDISLSTTLDV